MVEAKTAFASLPTEYLGRYRESVKRNWSWERPPSLSSSSRWQFSASSSSLLHDAVCAHTCCGLRIGPGQPVSASRSGRNGQRRDVIGPREGFSADVRAPRSTPVRRVAE
jgi:hypothetical protein